MLRDGRGARHVTFQTTRKAGKGGFPARRARELGREYFGGGMRAGPRGGDTMRRAPAVASGVAAVMVACGGAWWAIDAAGGKNAESSSPSANSSPNPSDLVVPLALPGEVTSDPSLPGASPLPDGIWDETGPGWVLATYRAEASGAGEHAVGPQVVYLVAPSGERYQVLELPQEPAVRLEEWVAGANTATVLPGAWDPSGSWTGSDWSTLSLTTGEVTSNGWTGLSPSAQFIDTTADGTPIWWNPGIAPDWPEYGIVDSSGAAVAYDYAGPRRPAGSSPDTGAPVPGEPWCQAAASYDATSVVEFCQIVSDECCDAPPGLDVGGAYRYVRRWTDGSDRVETLKEFTLDDPAPSLYDVAVGRGRVVFEGSAWRPGSEPVGAFVLEGGAVRRLAGIDATGSPEPHRYFVSLVGESAVYTAVGAGPSAPPLSPIALVRTDLDTNGALVLFPYPVGGSLGNGSLTFQHSLTSYIILDALPVPFKSG